MANPHTPLWIVSSCAGRDIDGMSIAPLHTAMMAQTLIASNANTDVAPEWIHLLPAPSDGLVQTGDKRGPYTLAPFAEIIENSFADSDALEIDIQHATYLAAPKGGDARAVGWIKGMEAREDGLWGRVEWTEEGRQLVASRAYRGISPVVLHSSATDKRISRLANAGLVNRPNLKGLTQLHQQETHMTFMQRMAKILGLKDDASEDDIASSMKKALKASDKTETTALQSAMTDIGVALGVEGGDSVAILTAAQAKANGADDDEVTALQSEIAGLTKQVNTLTEGNARKDAETFVDAEIKRGRAGLKPSRDRFISMHMADADNAVAVIEAMPVLTGEGHTLATPPGEGGVLSLNAEQSAVARQFGMSEKEYLAELNGEEGEAQ